MGRFSVFGEGIPGIDPQELRGNLIVIEGADGVGRSTQIWLLKQWLENQGTCRPGNEDDAVRLSR